MSRDLGSELWSGRSTISVSMCLSVTGHTLERVARLPNVHRYMNVVQRETSLWGRMDAGVRTMRLHFPQ